MINAQDGILAFAQPSVRIGPSLTRTEFLAADWVNGATDFIANEPWHSWKLAGEYQSASVPFVVVLYFEGERLTMVELCHSDPKFGTSWEDYSAEKELQLQAIHDAWLSNCVAAQRSFAWGTAWSGYDQRAGISSIVIRYGGR